MVEPNPTVARRMLAVYFKDLREQRKRGLDELAATLGVAPSQASRLDTGARGFRLTDIDTLCEWYELSAPEEKRLMALAVESRGRSWWQQVPLPDSYRTLIGLERAAVAVDEYCSAVIPGLLQTPDYARAAVLSSNVHVEATVAKQAVDVRVHRQDILDRPDPPELSVVIEDQLGPNDTSDDEQVKRWRRLWQTLQTTALSTELSAERITYHRDQLPS